MLLVQPRISHLIYGGVILLIGVVFWLAQGRYALLDAIHKDFVRLQEVAQVSRIAADTAGPLAALSAAIREYVASDAIEPAARIVTDSRALLEAIKRARQELPGEKADIDRLDAEAHLYVASFDAVVAARAQRQVRLQRLARAAGGLRASADAAGQLDRFLRIREAEHNYLLARHGPDADRVVSLIAQIARAVPGRTVADAAADYSLAFARIVDIDGVLDQATLRVMDDHETRLRAQMLELGRRAHGGEQTAVSDFRNRLANAIRRNVEVSLVAMLITIACAFLLLRYVIHPLNRMTTAMTEIARGDSARPVPFAGRNDEIGQMAQALSTFRNALLGLTEAQAQAELASRHKSDFIANMSHELRTPLNAIIGLSDMLLEDADHPRPSELKESLPRIAASAKHLLALINEILDLSKIEAGRMSVDISTFAPASLAEESLATVAPIARQKGLAVAVAYPQGLPNLSSDPRRLRQILINLLGNAVKFTDMGEVRLLLSRTPTGLRFVVSDTGPGITSEDQGRLFQDFMQIDASATRKYGGTGLGLALSRRMAHLIGGDITVRSEVGQGSTFTLDLPLIAPQMATEDRGNEKIRVGMQKPGSGGSA